MKGTQINKDYDKKRRVLTIKSKFDPEIHTFIIHQTISKIQIMVLKSSINGTR